MSVIALFKYELEHVKYHYFKIVALVLFVVLGIYGLHNGLSLYMSQNDQITQIETQLYWKKQKVLDCYEQSTKINKNKPWIDINTAYWSIYNLPKYHCKKPSPLLVYNIGQSQQYGFYKEIKAWSSSYDSDMTAEISNPEGLQLGTLDFAFVILYVLPLLLLILL